MFFVLVVILISVALGLSFIALNSTEVDINFFFFKLNGFPVAFGLFITLAIGVLLGLLAGLGVLIPAWVELKRLRRQKEIVEIELNKLRTMPLSNE